jgi:predicted Kef-type K+ transport protein
LPAVFLAVLAGHFLLSTRGSGTLATGGVWARYDFATHSASALARYVAAGDLWVGLSYAVAATFVAFSVLRLIERRRSTGAALGGMALGGLLWAAICFVVGCCGSPMLPIYLGLLGPRFLGVTKPLTLVLTLASIAAGYAVMLRRDRACGLPRRGVPASPSGARGPRHEAGERSRPPRG